jgi:hypothetical protein
MPPIQIVQTLLNKLGVKLTCVGRDPTPDGRRGGLRVYQYLSEEDEREVIFSQWRDRDEIHQLELLRTEATPSDIRPASDPPPDI